jgi:hypothetical protein
MSSHDSGSARARQARLVDWLKHPTGVPQGPAIDYSFAAWTAQELVDLTGLYVKRSEALYDLRALRDRGVVVSAGGRWRYHHVWEDRAEAVR